MPEKKFPCPCCGHVVFSDPPGSYDICLVCFWEDDLTQLRWPKLAGAANAVSLKEAQRNVMEFGASEQGFIGDVRAPADDEPLDPEWRPIAETDSFESDDEAAPWPEDATTLYYWRRTFWRKPSNS